MRYLKISIICATLFCAAPAFAQTDINIGAVNSDPNAPVEITADNLSLDQVTNTAVFVGNVVVGQNDLRISAPRVQVNYDDATGEMSTLSASGGVTLVTATEAAESTTAEYNLVTRMLDMAGDVLLTQGPSVISGDTMTVDLSTGAAQMSGNVRTIFNQGGN